MSAFLSVVLLTDFAAFCLTDFMDWRYIHSWFVFSTQLVNYCPHGRRNYTLLVYCCPSIVPSLWPPSPSPPSRCTVYTDSVWLWGIGGVLKCTVDHILQEFYTLFLSRFRTYKIASSPLTKMTSKDDIKGLVSLKFLRPWVPQSVRYHKLPPPRVIRVFYPASTSQSRLVQATWRVGCTLYIYVWNILENTIMAECTPLRVKK